MPFAPPQSGEGAALKIGNEQTSHKIDANHPCPLVIHNNYIEPAGLYCYNCNPDRLSIIILCGNNNNNNELL